MNFIGIKDFLPQYGGKEIDDDKFTRFDSEQPECLEGGEFDKAMEAETIDPQYLSQDG